MNAVHAISLLLLGVPAVTSLFYFGVSAILLDRWLKEAALEKKKGAPLPPVTFFRPLKAGVPDLFAKLAALARALRTGDQLLIGVEPHSSEWKAAEQLRLAHLDREIVPVLCAPVGAQNPKIAKLLQMEQFARHEDWILSDSEAMTDAAFLDAFRREWAQCDVLTAGYRFSQIATWPQRLDAAGVLLGLWPGLAVLRAAGQVRLTLGACTGFRRADLQAVGGWRAFADDLAEDNRLGRELAAVGRRIRLSARVVTLQSDALSWRDYARHQRRVAVTYRVSNPMGFAGAWLTQGVTTSLLLACWRTTDLWAWGLCLGVFAVRCLTVRRAAAALRFPIVSLMPTVFLASLVETACWGLSWVTRQVWWGGKWRRVTWAGRFAPCQEGEIGTRKSVPEREP